MLLNVTRFRQTRQATLSRVHLLRPYQSPAFLCHGLEDVHRAVKVKHETRIPAGTYPLALRTFGGFHARYAERFKAIHKGMLWVKDVPGFTDILLHVGNTDQDTSGCLLLGIWRGGDNFIADSAKTYARVYAQIAPMVETGTLATIRFEDE